MPGAGELDVVGGVDEPSPEVPGDIMAGPPPPPAPADEPLALGDALSVVWVVTPDTLELGDGFALEIGEADGEDDPVGQGEQPLILPSSQSLST